MREKKQMLIKSNIVKNNKILNVAIFKMITILEKFNFLFALNYIYDMVGLYLRKK